jgi:hypothetical protein
VEKHVLLICNQFRNYPQLIKSEFEARGYTVDYYPDQPDSFVFRKFTALFPVLLQKLWLRWLLSAIVKKKYDKILVIKGQGLNGGFIKTVFDLNKDAEKIFYTWDSLANYDCNWLWPYFNHCFSFDRKDTIKNPKLIYLPLFHSGAAHSYQNRDIDLFTLSGGGFAFRKPTLDKLIRHSSIKELRVRFYLLKKKNYLIQLFRKDVFFEYLWKPISYQKYQELLKRSKVVIDIHHASQSGLTMRTMEALSMGCKLATTNHDILKEKPELKDWVFLLDREQPKIPLQWINHIPSTNLNLDAYHVNSFLISVFPNTTYVKL